MKPTAHEGIVQHVAMSRAVTFAIPSGLIMGVACVEQCVGSEELVDTEVQQPHAILVALPKARDKIGVYSGIKITPDDAHHVFRWNIGN